MDIKTFHKRFRALSGVEQDILKVLAIAYESVPVGIFLDILAGCGVKRESGLSLSKEHLDRYRDLLDAGGWLQDTPSSEIGMATKMVELAMRMAVIDPMFKTYARTVQRHLPYHTGAKLRSFGAGIRDLRLALYEDSLGKARGVVQELLVHYPAEFQQANFFESFFQPFDPVWLNTFPVGIQEFILENLVGNAAIALEPVQHLEDFILQYGWLEEKEKKRQGHYLLDKIKTCQGKFKETRSMADAEEFSGLQLMRKGTSAFFTDQNSFALECFQGGLKLLYRQSAVPNRATHASFYGAIHLLAVLKEKQPGYIEEAAVICSKTTENSFDPIFAYLQGAVLFQKNFTTVALKHIETLPPRTPLEWLFHLAARYWSEMPPDNREMVSLYRYFQKANENGYRWLTMEFATLISKFEQDENTAKRFEIIASQIGNDIGTQSILTVLPKTEKWQRNLEALLQLKSRKNANKKEEKENRLAWVADFDKREIQAIEQSFGNGGWSKGRVVSPKRLKEGALKYLTNQDREAIGAIETVTSGYYGSTLDFQFNFDKLVNALIGHPLLFLEENRSVALELVAQPPQLVVEEKEEGFEIKFAHPFSGAGTQLVRETPTRYLVVHYDESHTDVLHFLGPNGALAVPKEAREKLVQVVGHLSSFLEVQSDIGGQTVSARTVEANPIPHIHLLPIGQGFKIEFFVKPFTTEPPYFKPGMGREMIVIEMGGAPTKTRRDPKLEKKNAKRIEDACPTLLRSDSNNLEWHFESAEDCLTVLLELEPLRTAGEVVLEHPKGEKLRISGHLGFDQFSIGIRKERNWFELEGTVQVSENLVMDFRRLLDLAQQSKGNFIEISDGQFLSITGQLRRKLDDLNSVISKTKNDMRFHPLAAPMLEGFAELVHDLQTDVAWKNQLARLKEARDINPPVPGSFKAELRNYQLEGFRWLSQLAFWGVGACLADDMGLGKTVQALALILDRADAGPALVVAPASVVRNWYHEAQRFTPTLRLLVFGETNRREMLDDLQPFDLLLCSYGLLQQDSKHFLEKHFSTIVLDEAQAIKNRTTKRSQAAMQLQGDFRIITTGTPIENHLGELWNLFNFLNPGLLGSLQHFNEMFAFPIERFQDKSRRNQLKRLLQPFILRRRKSEVLAELPAKTEITLNVELSADERAFYEAIRRRALENIESGDGQTSDKRFLILAELMRLRQACCHPRMIEPTSTLSSSKLNLLADTVEELIEEGHKVLVFSQFVKHLKLVEEWVISQKIPYQYLDGSTPLVQRDKAIRAFQSGEGDLFLISLKAGGFGLNLTAADYVIHLDPWWNPAVEDQASDRAHRIGQLRPVTVYRLVAENTIEEKIVKMHAEKRDLADSLLDGTELSAKMSAEELLELMKG